jgi:hypothetical protein
MEARVEHASKMSYGVPGRRRKSSSFGRERFVFADRTSKGII